MRSLELHKFAVALMFSGLVLTACSAPVVNNTVVRPVIKASPQPTIKDGIYKGRGTVTKIDRKIGSLELDHEEIPGLMPAMRMEFYVKPESQLTGLTVGEKVSFDLSYQGGTETIVKIDKVK